MSSALIIFLLIVIGGSVTALMLTLRARAEEARKRFFANRKTVLLRILVPKNNEKTPAAAEHLFASLHGIYRADARFQDHISFEIAAREKTIEFYVHVPLELRDFIEGQIYAQYPTVDIAEVMDYARTDLSGMEIVGSELEFTKSDVFPIKTFPNFEVDPLAGITGVLAKVGEKDQIWIQTLIRPVSDTWQNKGLGYVTAVRSGTLKKGTFFGQVLKGIIDLFRPAPAPNKDAGPPKLSAPQEQALKAIEDKVTKLGFATKTRVIVLSPDRATANAKIHAVTGAYKQFNTVNMNGFTLGKIVTDAKIVDEYRQRSFTDTGAVMNIEELASIFHFPNVTVETPNIVWAGAKKGEPPASLPIEGMVTADELTLFGVTDFRGARQKFGIKVRDRRQHMYAIGKSGTGKSTMLENMAIDDIRKGRGVAIVDPHGDFINHILNFIPAERINDVIYFNPADRDFPLGFNILENVDPDLKNIIASGVVGIFKKIFGELSWGPRLEYILRNVILALLEYPDATMLSVMRVLVDKPYRNKVMEKVTDPVIRDFFINEYEKYDPKFRTEAIAPIQNKVGQFLSASTIRNIVGQPVSTFDMEDAMNTKKILLLDLSIGKIGEDSAALLGSMMITKIQMAAMRRANIENQDDRVDFYLYVDEFQNFATDSFATILSEARKYRLNLILTHQYIGQLPEPVAQAIFGNVGTMISFRVGASDAVALVKEYEPVFEANDLINLDNHHIYVKMSIDGVTRPAFSAVTLAPESEHNDNKEKIVRFSREQYARPRDEVEASIADTAIGADKDTVMRTVAAPAEEGNEPARVIAAPNTGQQTTQELKPKQQNVRTVTVDNQTYSAQADKKGDMWYFSAANPLTKPEEEKPEPKPITTQVTPAMAEKVMTAAKEAKKQDIQEISPDETVVVRD